MYAATQTNRLSTLIHANKTEEPEEGHPEMETVCALSFLD
jgi:hypothetical protein